jgi:phage FluMu gp28-like protein
MVAASASQRGSWSLTDDLACALDPVVFARSLGVEPDPWQAKVLRSPARQQILCCSRQSGKSTTVAILALHEAVYVPGSLVLVLGKVLQQARELFRKVMDLYARIEGDAPADVENRNTLELANGSRIVVIAAVEANIRGFSAVSLLLVDEAAWVPDLVYEALRPMLIVSGGRVVLLSTTNGRRGFFFQEWENGGADWQRTMITWQDCPRITPERIAQERRQIPASRFRAEYECQFVEVDDGAFAYDDVQAALSDDIVPLFPIMEVAS